jgi:RNA-binding protein
MPLTTQSRRELTKDAHALHPIVIIGNGGITQAVLAEIDRALFDHELIKIRIQGSHDKAQKKAMAEEFCLQLQAEFLRVIGHIVIIYRPSDKKKTKKAKD